MERGEYERKGEGGYEGLCAACGEYVQPDEPSVIRHCDDGITRGGIFHERCAPTGPRWFDPSEGAPDL